MLDSHGNPYTHSFPKEPLEMVRQCLEIRDDLKCWLKSNKNKWILVISGHDHKKIMNFIGDFLIPSISHKIPEFKKKS